MNIIWLSFPFSFFLIRLLLDCSFSQIHILQEKKYSIDFYKNIFYQIFNHFTFDLGVIFECLPHLCVCVCVCVYVLDHNYYAPLFYISKHRNSIVTFYLMLEINMNNMTFYVLLGVNMNNMTFFTLQGALQRHYWMWLLSCI